MFSIVVGSPVFTLKSKLNSGNEENQNLGFKAIRMFTDSHGLKKGTRSLRVFSQKNLESDVMKNYKEKENA